jgi:ABC-type microcin C transport system duplicated ATPase subunit YejF
LKWRKGNSCAWSANPDPGKSIIAHTVMGCCPATSAPPRAIRMNGEDLLGATAPRMRQLRGAKMSMIFQEPMTALNPVMTCGSQIDELLVQHARMSARERRARILENSGARAAERSRSAFTGVIRTSFPAASASGS